MKVKQANTNYFNSIGRSSSFIFLVAGQSSESPALRFCTSGSAAGLAFQIKICKKILHIIHYPTNIKKIKLHFTKIYTILFCLYSMYQQVHEQLTSIEKKKSRICSLQSLNDSCLTKKMQNEAKQLRSIKLESLKKHYMKQKHCNAHYLEMI